MRPLRLAANTPRSFYRGTGRIHRFRGLPVPADAYYPEDWVGSTTARYRSAPAGLTVLDEGRTLAEEMAAEPVRWLGPEHVARFGPDPAILVKLLDAGERLPLHVHPDRRFGRDHLASPYGKTEAWVIVDAVPDAVVHLGFARDVEPDELTGWARTQQIAPMLAATNHVPVRRGDAVLVPAGLPHAIGPGIFLVEVQEPTDFSVLLEREGFPVSESSAYLGLGMDEALACVDRGAWNEGRLADLSRARRDARQGRQGVERLFPEQADEFFAAERLRPDPVSDLDEGFSIIVMLSGHGSLRYAEGTLPITAGDTMVVPFGAGRCELRGELEAIRCRPALRA
ncbi:class I mannose-6-phosphate isomerase [Micromonospora coerulea]|uniref:Class I mannose-6-phosphate isomerase n=1 Tax=Micromonospora coerulea TaxID=47856 RepID=A0ABP8SUS0_9ACTN|nr:carbohydrate kinase [Micromonospora veneta]